MNIAYTALAIIIAAGVAGAYGYLRGEESGRLQVQSKWDAERAELESIHARDQQIAREREKLMQQTADRIRQEKDLEIRNLNARSTALANSLRDRPSRPADTVSALPSSTDARCPTPVCTGAGLSREDALFLTGEAARGAEAVALLKQCHAQYESLKTK